MAEIPRDSGRPARAGAEQVPAGNRPARRNGEGSSAGGDLMAAVRALPDRSPFRVIEVLQYRADDRGYERGCSKATENAEDIS